MFDRYEVDESDNSVEQIVVHKEITSGKTLSVYRELEEKSFRSVVDKLTLNMEQNQFNIVSALLNPVIATRERWLYINFRLNGKEYEVKQSVDICYQMSPWETARLAIEKIGEIIAKKIVGDILKKDKRAFD